MKCVITRKKNIKISAWSGGSTAQLFIYPPNADYAKRDFEARISSATVEEETSVFTHLPGYHRILMPLNAPLRLVFQDHGEVSVNPMEAAEFEGDWHTVSHGVCTDLGLMLAAGWQGEMEAVGSGVRTIPPGITGVYSLADQVEVSVEESLRDTLMQGDFLLMESRAPTKFSLTLAPALESPSANAAVLVRIFRASRK